MAFKTRPVFLWALGIAACGGLGNPDGSATGATSSVPPWTATDGKIGRAHV